MRQRRTQCFEIGWPEAICRKDLDEIRACFVRQLRFGRCVCAEHDRAVRVMRDSNELRPANRCDYELRACCYCRATGFVIKDCAHANQRAALELLASVAD